MRAHFCIAHVVLHCMYIKIRQKLNQHLNLIVKSFFKIFLCKRRPRHYNILKFFCIRTMFLLFFYMERALQGTKDILSSVEETT